MTQVPPSPSHGPVLAIRGLRTEFRSGRNWYPAVRGLDLTLNRNETLAVVGESGSGKSVTALSILRLLPEGGARIAAGNIELDGKDLLTLSERDMDRVRGDRIGMVFQEPMTALNPTMRIGDQVEEALRIHRGLDRAAARREALALLEEVKLPSAAQRMHEYPHQFSGGMRQRVVIAMALACRPQVLLADEPTTALDVTIQAQVLSLLDELKRTYGMSMMIITHNLGVVALIADRVAVMYAGQVVEEAPVRSLFAMPRHPYTEALLRATPRVDEDAGTLAPIPGQVPSIRAMPPGCAYAPRCPLRRPPCETEVPPLQADGDRLLRCWVRNNERIAA
ncbi:ABC transporter ATP-binding protein [Azospirillum sp. TSO35-2]|uniref:ABC transporter ATP-binding protein n=1 Tax=Azospirillum sp. TSO35-2 TaxID=716796 RepID=UPI000D6121DE|nr:ABC transporter ATP-binding protein [Azospirillum sp. TSO35-2]PWC31050.1 peptide ABC transporter ATPase [Azospirillum sp. TSO35-2]